MNRVLDDSLVGLALLASAGYAVASLGPRALRQRFLTALGRLMGRAPAFLGLGPMARRLDAAAAAKSSGACGGCDNCGSEQPPTQTSPAAEVRVPVAKIGRRA